MRRSNTMNGLLRGAGLGLVMLWQSLPGMAQEAPGATGSPSPVSLVSAEDWARPRSAQMILNLPGVSDAVRQLGQHAQGILVIRHAATDEGALWASELRDWLVSLGIASQHIRLLAEQQRAMTGLELTVADRKQE